MSWLGEQFSSFTEKLTDLTKDVLIDSGANASTEGVVWHNPRISYICCLKLH